VARNRFRSLEERVREVAAAEVRRIFASMSPEELAILAFGTTLEERSGAECAEALSRHSLTEELFKAAVGPDGLRGKAIRKTRMESFVRWTVWPRAREIRAARARLEVEGRPIGKPPWGTDNETEQVYREAARSLRSR
jgi:hypothetical protein